METKAPLVKVTEREKTSESDRERFMSNKIQLDASATDASGGATETAPKAPKVIKKKSVIEEPETPMLHGIVVNSGDVKKGGTKKAPVAIIVDVKNIHVQPEFNPRRKLGDLSELQASIKEHGPLTAILIRPSHLHDKPGQFLIVAGERRFKSCKANDMEAIPAVIRGDLFGAENDDKARAAAIAENSEDGRNPLNIIDLGLAAKGFEAKGWSVKKIAGACGVNEQQIRRALELVSADEDIQKKVGSGKMAMTTGLELAKLSPETRKAIAKDIDESTSAAKIKELAKAAVKKAEEIAESQGQTSADTTGAAANYKKGSARDAALITRRGPKEMNAVVDELAHRYVHVGSDDMHGNDWYELRGVLSGLIFQRGDLDSPILPEVGSEGKDGKVIAKFDKLVGKFAKAYAEAHPDEASDSESGNEDADDAAGAPTDDDA